MTDTTRKGELKVGVVFGGSGLIGGTIVNFYKQRRPGLVEMFAPSSKKVSLRNCEDIRTYLLSIKPDFVVNCAIANINSDPQLAFEVNYVGAINIARAAAALKIPYIFFSSAATLPPGRNLKEDNLMPLTAHLSNYAKSKLMAEKTLDHMAKTEGLDYSCIRLSIAYGNHDHKIQGFQRLLFSIADQSMPVLFTKKGCIHSYSNSRKIPYLVHHMIENREEFGGNTYNFVDPEPVELADLIMTIKTQLDVKHPCSVYVPYSVARPCIKTLRVLLRLLRKLGIQASMPPELMFLGAFYRTQTLSCEKLKASSFVDPLPEETVYTRLPEMISYYLTRWSHLNLITTFDEKLEIDESIRSDFRLNPQKLLEMIHLDSTTLFQEASPEGDCPPQDGDRNYLHQRSPRMYRTS